MKRLSVMMAAAVALFVACAAPGALADVVTLNDGRVLDGKIIEETATTVKVKLQFGAVTVQRADVKSIQRGESAVEKLEKSLEALHPSAPQGYFDLGKWCLEQKDCGGIGAKLLKMTAALDADLYVTAYTVLGDYYFARKDKTGATAAYASALAADPTLAALAERLSSMRGSGGDSSQEDRKAIAAGLKSFLDGKFADALDTLRKIRPSVVSRQVERLLGCTIDDFVRFCAGAMPCATCRGTGRMKCGRCDGKGTWKCPDCQGSGVRDSAGISSQVGTGKTRCGTCNGFGGFLCERCKAVRIVYLQRSASAVVKKEDCSYYKEMTPNHEFDPYADPDFKQAAAGSGNKNATVGSKVIGGTVPCIACAAKRGDKSVKIEATKERIAAVEALLRRESVSLAVEEMFCGRMPLVGAAQPDADIMSSKAVVWHEDKWMTVEEKAAVVKGVEAFQWPPKKGRELDVRDIRDKAVELQISANAIPEGMQELARMRAATQEIPRSKAAMNELKFRRTAFLRDDVKAKEAVCVFRIDGATGRIQLIMRRKETDRATFLLLLEPESFSTAFDVPDDAGADSLKTGGELVVYYAVVGNSAGFRSDSKPWVFADAAKCYFLLIEIHDEATHKVLRSWRP